MRLKKPIKLHAGDLVQHLQTKEVFRVRWAVRADQGVELTGAYVANPNKQVQLEVRGADVRSYVVQKPDNQVWFALENYL